MLTPDQIPPVHARGLPEGSSVLPLRRSFKAGRPDCSVVPPAPLHTAIHYSYRSIGHSTLMKLPSRWTAIRTLLTIFTAAALAAQDPAPCPGCLYRPANDPAFLGIFGQNGEPENTFKANGADYIWRGYSLNPGGRLPIPTKMTLGVITAYTRTPHNGACDDPPGPITCHQEARCGLTVSFIFTLQNGVSPFSTGITITDDFGSEYVDSTAPPPGNSTVVTASKEMDCTCFPAKLSVYWSAQGMPVSLELFKIWFKCQVCDSIANC